PILLRVIDSLQESSFLFLFRNVKKKFPYDHAIPCQVLLEVTNVLEPILPNLFAYEFWRQLLLCQKLVMHPDDEHFFIITAVKNSNLTPVRQGFHAASKVSVI